MTRPRRALRAPPRRGTRCRVAGEPGAGAGWGRSGRRSSASLTAGDGLDDRDARAGHRRTGRRGRGSRSPTRSNAPTRTPPRRAERDRLPHELARVGVGAEEPDDVAGGLARRSRCSIAERRLAEQLRAEARRGRGRSRSASTLPSSATVERRRPARTPRRTCSVPSASWNFQLCQLHVDLAVAHLALHEPVALVRAHGCRGRTRPAPVRNTARRLPAAFTILIDPSGKSARLPIRVPAMLGQHRAATSQV